MDVWAVGAAQTLGRDIVLGPLSPNGVLLAKPVSNFSNTAACISFVYTGLALLRVFQNSLSAFACSRAYVPNN